MMKTLIKILCLSVFWFSCNSPTESEPEGCDGDLNGDAVWDECGVCDGDGLSCNIPNTSEICENIYSDVDGSLISCDEDCELISDDCYHLYDLQVLTEIKETNEINYSILQMGYQNWNNGRLTYLSLFNFGINYLPEAICNLDCELHLDQNSLCDEYQYDCIDYLGEQDISGCEGYSEYGGEWYYDSDLEVLSDLKDTNESLIDIVLLEIGGQIWEQGRLVHFQSDNHQLTSIPESIGNLSSLGVLDLSTSQLTAIPSEIGNLTNLTYLNLVWNQLTELPSEIGNLTNLGSLYLYQNQLAELPSEIGNLSSLGLLDLTYNQLTTLPESICNLWDECLIFVDENQLCSEYYYDCIDSWGNQSNESMDECGICNGGNADQDCNGDCFGDAYVDDCDVCSEGDTGHEANSDQDCAGECFGDNVDEDNDGICDEFDDCVGEYDECGGCNGDGYDCGGSCYEENLELWGNCYNIETTTEVLLNNSQLTGEIPSEIGELINLERLYLYNNQLTGEIPSEIENLSSLVYLYLFSNQLSGVIPPEIGNMTNLLSLNLNTNQLSGVIPPEICNQGDNTPSVSGNQLCPPYPSCISQDDIDSQDTSNCP